MSLNENAKFIRLNNKRDLSFYEFGNPDGKAVIYFHGFPGSALEVKRFTEIAKHNNYRLIAIDRPGMGQSTIDKNRTILSTVNDVIAVADFLNLGKFLVLGHSGGAVYVSACAYLIPERLNAAAIVSAMAPFADPATHSFMSGEQRIGCKLVKKLPFMAIAMMYITRMMLKKSDKMLEKMIKPLPEVDKAVFRDANSRKEIIDSCLEAFRHGLSGTAFEMCLILNEWGFNLQDISFPVSIWHGAEDTQAVIANANYYKQLMPNAKLTEFAHDGHHSIMLNHFEQILNSL